MISYPCGQDGATLPARDCPFCSRNNILLTSKQVHESILELENERAETRHHFCYNWLPFQCSQINKYEDYFFQFSLCHIRIINPLLTKRRRPRWHDIGLVFFLRFNEVLVHKNAKRELYQYPAILNALLVNN